MVWSYEDAVAWLYGRQAIGIKLGLEKVRALMAALGDPQDSYKIVHVAGTNGKGSVTTMLAAVLQGSGHRVGYTISPHLISFTERVVVDGQEISKSQVAALLDQIKPHVDHLDAKNEHPTFFEIVTALALLHFKDENVDWAVLETGLGGRLDATNIVNPELSVITNVERDHVAMLGDSPQQVATEKAGIMKPGVPCVTGASGPALQVIKQRSADIHAPLSVVGEDYVAMPDVNGLRLLHPGGDAHYDLAMAGAHQIANAALVLAAADALRSRGHVVTAQATAKALSTWRFAGRLESFTVSSEQGNVEVLIDGAHNEAGANALRAHLAARNWAGFDLICGFQGDKDWPRILDYWLPITARGWGVALRSPRTLPPARMEEAFGIVPFSVAPSAGAAIEAAIAGGATKIVVSGSLWLVGEARAHLTGQSVEEIRGSQ